VSNASCGSIAAPVRIATYSKSRPRTGAGSLFTRQLLRVMAHIDYQLGNLCRSSAYAAWPAPAAPAWKIGGVRIANNQVVVEVIAGAVSAPE
jgi:hypothetical protein